jgi:hypothetical protein
MGTQSPISVGSVVTAKPVSSTTVRVGLTETVRHQRDVTILSSEIVPADAWEKLECASCTDIVEYRALRENTGTLTVRADDGLGAETFARTIVATTPTTVKLFDQP